MPELPVQYIERIKYDVKKQEITFSHLADDLIDHICCDVENEMENGLTFLEAYKRVKQKMTPRRLKEIQEETLYVIDTKYRFMKNTMKISGVTGAVLFGFATLFKIQHWAGAGIMMTLGALVLAFVFMPSSLAVLWKETHNSKKITMFISSFLTVFFFIFGVLFKIQHWDGAGIILTLSAVFGSLFFIPALLVSILSDKDNKSKRPFFIIGIAGLIFFLTGLFLKIQHLQGAALLLLLGLVMTGVVFFPWYTWFEWKDEKYMHSRFLFILVGSLLIIIPAAMLNLNLQYAYEDGFYPYLEQQQALFNQLYRKTGLLVPGPDESIKSSQIIEINSKTNAILSMISNMQINMVQESEGKPGAPALAADKIKLNESGPEIIFRSLSKPFHPAPVNDFLLPGKVSRQELDNALKDYVHYVTSLNLPEELRESIKLILTSSLLPEKKPGNRPAPLISGLHTLELLKNFLLTVETNILLYASIE